MEIITFLDAIEEIKQDIELFSMLYITLLGESVVFCRYTALVQCFYILKLSENISS